ncbi:MAG: tetratricopeptide repeat protein [Bacteroidales bacterium]|nr:tetratricopeptide repeat protein [Bacteroidales bacterium]
MSKIYSVIVLVLFSFAVKAQTDSLLLTFDAANKFYENNNFQSAIDSYEQILATGYEASEIYYNLGNSYFKNNNFPYAILNYERALKLKPNDDDIIYNIEYSNLYIKDQYNQVPDFIIDKIHTKIVHSADSNTWAILSISFFILSLIVFMIFLFSKIIIRRKIAFFISILFMFISIVSFAFSSNMKSYFQNPNAAIMMEISTLKSSPQTDGTDLFIINPGVKLIIEDKNTDWFEVKLPNGVKGWVKKDMLEVI